MCLDVREHQQKQHQHHQRARETRVVVVVVVSSITDDAKRDVFFDGGVREATLGLYFRKASTPTPRRIDRAFCGSDDDTRLVVHEESRFGAVLRRARAGREWDRAGVETKLRDAVSSSADDDRDDDDDDFAASGERRGETVAVVEATKSDGGFAKESTLFSIKDEADDEEQDAIARKLAVELAVEADDTRAKDVRVLRVSKAVYYARYVVLATAFNRPQMSAVTSKMRDVANNDEYNLQIPKNVANQGDWTCLDCRDVVAHVFTPTARTYYDLEDLYRECDEVGLPFETERMHDGFYAEEDGDFYENEDEDESEDLEDEFEINWSEM